MPSKRASLRKSIQGDTTLRESIHSQMSDSQDAGQGELNSVPVERITLNPDNPRRLSVGPEDMRALVAAAANAMGVPSSPPPSQDPRYFRTLAEEIEQIEEPMRTELERIVYLAASIKNQGLKQPIVVHMTPDGYQVHVGERRTLAHMLLANTHVRAIIQEATGDPVDDQIGMLIENLQREDLNLGDRLDALERLIKLQTGEPDAVEHITAAELTTLIHEPMRTCGRYLRVMRAPAEIRQQIRDRRITTIRAAEEAIRNLEQRSGTKRSSNKNASRISMGTINNPRALKSLISVVAQHFSIDLDTEALDTSAPGELKSAWTKLIEEVSRGLEFDDEEHRGSEETDDQAIGSS